MTPRFTTATRSDRINRASKLVVLAGLLVIVLMLVVG